MFIIKERLLLTRDKNRDKILYDEEYRVKGRIYSFFFAIFFTFKKSLILINKEKNMTRNQLNVGVIGSGAISDIYLQNMTKRFDVLNVKAVASKHIENAEKKAEKYGLTACTVDELLNDPEIDIIVNLTPVGVHYDIIKRALNCGKHVYTEKTLTDSVERSRELVELANEKGLYLTSAPDTFFGAATQTAREAIEDGLIGKVHSFVMSATRNNDMLLSLFSFLREEGAGIVNDFGVYYITNLVSILGNVKRVGGICQAPYKEHRNILPMSPDFGKMMSTPNESRASALIIMENGVTGTLHLDADCIMNNKQYFAIYGSKGVLYLDDPNNFEGTITFVPNALDPRKPVDPITLMQFSKYKENSRGVGVADMAEAILSGKNARADKEMALHVQEVLAAILKGKEEGMFTDIETRFTLPEKLDRKDIGIKNIGHTSFNAKNMDEMLRFYCDVLGMEVQFKLTFGDLINSLDDKTIGGIEMDEQKTKQLEMMKNVPWLVYLKLADRQYIELFYDIGAASGRPKEDIGDRNLLYGYRKVNFEVDDIEKAKEILVENGITLIDDIHQTIEGAKELHVKDPDGNDVMLMEYGKAATAFVPDKDETGRNFFGITRYTSQVAYTVKDEANMLAFYTKGLGLKKVNAITFEQLSKVMSGETAKHVAMLGDKTWIDYIEVAPHQYIELFRNIGQDLSEKRDLLNNYGYQHLCLEVEDIHKAWDAVIANGITPDTEIKLGADNSYQFWLVDPDGNRLELMQYPEDAYQLCGKK